MNRLERIIEETLNQTKKDCDFKRAWIPKGWVCVRPKRFSKELAEKLAIFYNK